jgi:hypothetical protein
MQAQTPRWFTAVTRSKASIGSWRHLDAGIVKGHIESAVLGNCTVDRGRYLRLVGDVARDADRGAAFPDDPFGFLRREVAVEIGEDDECAAFGECTGGCQPHAHRRARDKSDLALEVIDRVHGSASQY